MAKALWCLHVRGPNDVIAALTLQQAEDAAVEFNRLYYRKANGFNPTLEVSVEVWPHGAESHAHSLTHDWPEYAKLARAGRRWRLKGN